MNPSVSRRAVAVGPVLGLHTGLVPELTIVMPYYNPGDRLGRNVGDVVAVLEHANLDFEVIAVSDGSTDGSGRRASEPLDHGRVRRIELARHKGKGEALRVGLAEGRGRYLGFIDADGDLPAELSDRSYPKFARATSTSCSAARGTADLRSSTRSSGGCTRGASSSSSVCCSTSMSATRRPGSRC